MAGKMKKPKSAGSRKIRVSVCGASGYTGIELLRLLAGHPAAEVVYASSEKSAGQSVTSLFPFLRGKYDSLKLQPLDPVEATCRADIIFTALPHAEAAPTVIEVLKSGGKVVDLSADFRLRDACIYEKTYGHHPAPQLLKDAVYGLPELYRDRIRRAQLVANPGCYPQGPVLSLAPLIRDGLIEPEGIIIDAKSGVSGAGRGAVVDNLFCEVNSSFKAYKIFSHRHVPEIEQELSLNSGLKTGGRISVTFTPHLVPMNRGILSTVYARANKKVKTADLLASWKKSYGREPFVRICPENIFPATRDVAGTNFVDMSGAISPDGRVIIVTAIDNLCRGASGVAVQNMNLMMGRSETESLSALALVP